MRVILLSYFANFKAASFFLCLVENKILFTNWNNKLNYGKTNKIARAHRAIGAICSINFEKISKCLFIISKLHEKNHATTC